MRSRKILILIARTVYFLFLFNVVNQPFYQNEGIEPRLLQYGARYVYADSFDDMLKRGKDLARGIVPNFTPQNLNWTLGSKGLGNRNSIVPHNQEASQQYGTYSSYASHPEQFQGMEPDPNDPIVKFLTDSYNQKDKFDLTHDPTFGQECLQAGPDGKCQKWSSSKDLFTRSYQDCQKVELPIYDSNYSEETCIDSTEQKIDGSQCIDRAWTELKEEVYTYPCNQIDPGYLDGQIYVGCRDRYYWFKLKDRTETGECSCVDTETENCLANVPANFLQQAPPPGASFRGVTHENSAPADEGQCSYDVYKWYTAYETSDVERVLIRYDAPCRLESNCIAQTIMVCDPTGNNCMTLVDNGKMTGNIQDDSPAVKNFVAGLIGNYDVYIKPQTTLNMNGNAVDSSVVDFNDGIGLRELTQIPYRMGGSWVEEGITLTYFSIYGGLTVEKPKSGWYTKFLNLSCEREVSTCRGLEEGGCYVVSQECVDPDCKTISYTYRCGGTGGVLGYKSSYVCLNDLRCAGGECGEGPEEASQDFIKSATALEILNGYRTDTWQRGHDPSGWRVFPGKAYACQFSPIDCCKPETGQISILEYVAAAKSIYSAYTTFSDGFGSMVFSYESGISYAISQIFGTATSSTIEFMGETGLETANVTLTTSGYEVISSVTGLSGETIGTIVSVVSTVAAVVAVVMVAYTLVMFVYNLLFSCTKKDQETAAKLGFRLCVNTGSICSGSIFGICYSREKLYCCFNSILARIIQVQGRRQLWADHHIYYPWMLDDETPYCAGLKVEDFKKLDFSRIDLKEYMNFALKSYKKKVSDKVMQETLDRIKKRLQ